jgi:hypothetical protein
MGNFYPLVIIDPTVFIKIKNVTDNAYNFCNIQVSLGQLYKKLTEAEISLEKDPNFMPMSEESNYFLDLFVNFNNSRVAAPNPKAG